MSSSARERCRKLQQCDAHCSRNIAARDELDGIACRREPACIIAKELEMRNKILAIAAIAGVIVAPIAAQGQCVVTTGVAPGAAVGVEDVDGSAVAQPPALRAYSIRE